jgi:hypothetical protein
MCFGLVSEGPTFFEGNIFNGMSRVVMRFIFPYFLILGLPEPAIKVNPVMCKNPSILSGISRRNNDVLEISTFFCCPALLKSDQETSEHLYAFYL